MKNKLKIYLDFFSIIFAWTVGSLLAILFRYDFLVPLNIGIKLLPTIFTLTLTFYIFRFLDRKFFGFPRVATIEEFFSTIRIFFVTGMIYFISLLFYPNFLLPRSFPILTCILALGAHTVLIKIVKYFYNKILLQKNRVLVGIYGAGQQGQILLQKIISSNDLNWKPLIVYDDDSRLKLNKLNGTKVVTGTSLDAVMRRYKMDILVLTFSDITNEKLQNIQTTCSSFGVELRIIPPMKTITRGEFSVSDIRVPTQEELIGKSLIKSDYIYLKSFFENKVVLVTGAGGSIGSEISRQVSSYFPSELHLLDRDESSLLELNLTIDSTKNKVNKNLVLADIRDAPTIAKIFNKIKPDVVFHAAALKHLNMLEKFPEEGFKTNVQGTFNVLEASTKSEVKIFVNISTDKAADPISVLGISKLLAEQLTSFYSLNQFKHKFVSVRFGNVFASRGSAMQTFSRQIELGQPITITHPEVQRYFMTLEDSVHLVLQAATKGETGETLILKMAKPLLIKDLAEKLIQASGKKIEIFYSQLQPGEKLSESLIGENESPLVTSSEEIVRVKTNPLSLTEIQDHWSRIMKSRTINQNLG
jgi:FlaA1/EpsC-like NDP-sugar epimerase